MAAISLEERRRRDREAKRRWRANPENAEKAREVTRRWRVANAEKLRESQQRYRDENREKIHETQRRYREANREKRLENSRRWYMNNKEKTRESSRRWRKENTEKVLKSNREAGKRYIESGKKRNAYYLGKYGITAATADALLAKPCGICGEYTEHMRIDHDHATGAIRGALCHRCNIGLGYFNDGPARLRAALAYLERQAADGIETTIAV